MKSVIQHCLQKAISSAFNAELLNKKTIPLEYSRTLQHGDFSSSVALMLAKELKTSPLTLANRIVRAFHGLDSKHHALFNKIEVVQPGFINFFIQPDAWRTHLSAILEEQGKYGASDFGQQKSILLEFVSSNPTGPLHIGHGRAAAQGDILARVLKTIGYQVHTEYYVNDAGRQVDILAYSVWLRYLESMGGMFDFPVNAYQGEYIKTIAMWLKEKYHDLFYYTPEEVMLNLPLDASKGGDKEVFIDAAIDRAKTLLTKEKYQQLSTFSLDYIIKDMQNDLSEFDVHFDHWFSEKSLITSNSLDSTIQQLTERGHVYSSEGNLWFRSTTFGDDKDRVLLRSNGQPTYFAVDAAYRLNILKERGFSTIINLLGADHHGYLQRIHAVVEALGYPKDRIIFSTLQMVSLYRGNEKLPLSTRSGEFITLRTLRHEVGNDATRLFFISRKSSQSIDFDLDLAKSQSHQNPVYYLQYAYARIASLMRQLHVKKLSWSLEQGRNCLEALQLPVEIELIKQLTQYPSILVQVGTQCEPSLLLNYLKELAKGFHAYYNHTPILTSEDQVRHARLTLIQGVQLVLKNAFNILGIKALDVM